MSKDIKKASFKKDILKIIFIKILLIIAIRFYFKPNDIDKHIFYDGRISAHITGVPSKVDKWFK